MGEVREFRKEESRCKVCCSGFREVVDMMLVVGYPQTFIAEWLNNHTSKDGERAFTKQNIHEHRKRHLDLQSDVMVRVKELRQKHTMKAKDVMSEHMFDYVTALEQFVILGAARILNDRETKIVVKDWLRAIEILDRFEPMSCESYKVLAEMRDRWRETMKSILARELTGEQLKKIYEGIDEKVPYILGEVEGFWIIDNSSMSATG
jgi:hypothetical protein